MGRTPPTDVPPSTLCPRTLQQHKVDGTIACLGRATYLGQHPPLQNPSHGDPPASQRLGHTVCSTSGCNLAAPPTWAGVSTALSVTCPIQDGALSWEGPSSPLTAHCET